jgi:hypothetical protein
MLNSYISLRIYREDEFTLTGEEVCIDREYVMDRHLPDTKTIFPTF